MRKIVRLSFALVFGVYIFLILFVIGDRFYHTYKYYNDDYYTFYNDDLLSSVSVSSDNVSTSKKCMASFSKRIVLFFNLSFIMI